jgi:glutamate racemase
MNSQPIGVFDSGVGGLSVWKEIIKVLPEESIVYLADNAHCPYGPRPEAEIIALCEKNVDFLLSHQCKLMVVACNTATAAAIEALRSQYDIPFVGMEPAIKPAALHSKTGKVGVLATQGTVNGKLFKSTSGKYANHVEMHVQIGHGLVELVEAGKAESPEAEHLLRKYVEPMLEKGVDQIVLGCTHYPFLLATLQKITGKGVNIVDPAGAIALQTQRIVNEKSLQTQSGQPPSYHFYATGDIEVLKRVMVEITSSHNTYIAKSIR